ncbi:TOMM precursor leader peptide-binding protein [Corynebacterium sp.]|uniref:TOMM precursor leader peptide-binding protein n=1 Tax=Corynebacterium sp. TaxID=1720 RepID=UPI0026DC0CF6|nr:TOMM precursor leader peptide-binding protein [Corynebacterium sp.]MDO5032077.1 TOMM precursor leader peptide-binding protein [Corynebacterium sp.]
MNTPLYALSPYSALYQREEGVLQCGMDATRVGVIEGRPGLAAALNAVRTPLTRQEIEARLQRAGIGVEAARSIVDDLIHYNVLWPAGKRASVVVIGTSPLAQILRHVLREDGFNVRGPLGHEEEKAYLASVAGHFPIVTVDAFARAVELAEVLRGRGATVLPVAVLDSRGVVGPLLDAGRGPCPLCVHLHRIDADEHWHTVTERVAEHPAPGDDIVRTAVAMRAVATLRRLVGRPSPPGAPQHKPLAGELVEVDLYGHNQQRYVMEHPCCPHCRF